MRTPTCFAGVVLATGCAASPPVRARVGGTYHPTPVEYHGVEPGTTASASGVASTSIGLHAASAAELPFDVGVGVMTDFYRAGYYLEGAALRRIRPRLRVGATGAAEYWAAGERGLGGRAGVTAEWTSKPRAYSETETVKCTTSHAAVGGVWAIGLYLEAGYRAMFDEKNAVSINMASRSAGPPSPSSSTPNPSAARPAIDLMPRATIAAARWAAKRGSISANAAGRRGAGAEPASTSRSG